MIRIDLGKGAYEEKSGLSSKLKKLNLPPQVVARIQKLTADIGVIVTIIVAVAVALIFPLIGKQIRMQLIAEHEVRVKEMTEKLNAANSEIAKYNHYKAELESYNSQKTLVTNRLGVVSQLLEARGTPVNILDSVGQSLPGRTWYNTLDLTLTGDSPTMNIAGLSYSNEEISDLVEKLGESIYLSDVALEDLGTKAEDKVELRSFTITAKAKTKLIGAPSVAAEAKPENKK